MHSTTHVHNSTLVAYVMDSVSSSQVITTSHSHSPVHSYIAIYYPYAPCNAYIVYHTIPILSPSFLYHLDIPSFYYVRFFIYL